MRHLTRWGRLPFAACPWLQSWQFRSELPGPSPTRASYSKGFVARFEFLPWLSPVAWSHSWSPRQAICAHCTTLSCSSTRSLGWPEWTDFEASASVFLPRWGSYVALFGLEFHRFSAVPQSCTWLHRQVPCQPPHFLFASIRQALPPNRSFNFLQSISAYFLRNKPEKFQKSVAERKQYAQTEASTDLNAL